MSSRYKPIRMWGVMANDELLTTISKTRDDARGVASTCRRIRDLRNLSYNVRIVRLEVRIND